MVTTYDWVRHEITVPKTYGELVTGGKTPGEEIASEDMDALEQKIVGVFGGLSVRMVNEGHWRDLRANRVVSESNVVFVTDAPKAWLNIQQHIVKVLASQICTQFGQKEVHTVFYECNTTFHSHPHLPPEPVAPAAPKEMLLVLDKNQQVVANGPFSELPNDSLEWDDCVVKMSHQTYQDFDLSQFPVKPRPQASAGFMPDQPAGQDRPPVQ